jgi:hypothetical protein
MGPVLEKMLSQNDILTKENLENSRTQLEESLKKLLCILVLQCKLAQKSANLLKLWPYKSPVSCLMLHCPVIWMLGLDSGGRLLSSQHFLRDENNKE